MADGEAYIFSVLGLIVTFVAFSLVSFAVRTAVGDDERRYGRQLLRIDIEAVVASVGFAVAPLVVDLAGIQDTSRWCWLCAAIAGILLAFLSVFVLRLRQTSHHSVPDQFLANYWVSATGVVALLLLAVAAAGPSAVGAVVLGIAWVLVVSMLVFANVAVTVVGPRISMRALA